MTDEPNETEKKETGNKDAPPVDPRSYQRNLAERLFPGPSRPMSNLRSEHIEKLLRPVDASSRSRAWRDRQRGSGTQPSRPGRPSQTPPTAIQEPGYASRPASGPAPDSAPALESPTDAGPESGTAETGSPTLSMQDDISQLHDTLEEQNELLRALLASSIDTQTDARSTAQNSRTFAWAGTAIALLTLIATVIAVIAAVEVH